MSNSRSLSSEIVLFMGADDSGSGFAALAPLPILPRYPSSPREHVLTEPNTNRNLGCVCMSKARLVSGLRSPALASAAVFTAGGIGFALGNLLLARILPASEYGYISLFLSITQFGLALGPLGLDTLINRHRLGTDNMLLLRSAATGSLVGVLMGAVGWAIYGMSLALAVVLCVTVLAAALNRVAGAFFQSRQDFGFALFLTQIHNWILPCSVPLVLWLDEPEALPVALVAACGYALMMGIGWRKARQTHPARASQTSHPYLKEGLAIVGLQLAVSLLFQLDRLLIPKVLSIGDLAVYAVVASIAGAPFRMLQVGVGYSLLPRLRGCQSRLQAYQMIRHELAVMVAVSVTAAVVVMLLMPWIARDLLQGRYPISAALVRAIVLIGFVRVWNSFASAAVSALGSMRHLTLLNAASWVAVGVASLCAVHSGKLGLIGIVYGIGAGWALLAAVATVLALHAMHRWPRMAGAADT
jgi:O-antigen/teichoic acid export membrane protein